MTRFTQRLSQMTVKPIMFGDSASVDAFGLVRTTGKPGNRFDIEFIYDKQPELIDEITTGAATATHNSTSRDITLAINDSTVNDLAALYGFDVPYTPGSSQLIEITGTLNGAGLTGTAELFLRSSVTGSVVEQVYQQADWSASPENETTLERAPVDWSKSQIFAVDFQSLKVGRIRFGLSRSGSAVAIHTIENDNIRATGYWQTASLPPYWRIYNDAGYTYSEMGYGDSNNGIGLRFKTAVNAAATMRAICVTVKSEGGVSLLDIPGFQRSADNYLTTVTVGTTFVPILSIRPATTFNSLANRGLYIPTGYSIKGNNPMYYAILYRPTLTGASWGSVNPTYSGMQYDTLATAVTGGIIIDSDYFETGRNTVSKSEGLLGRTLLKLGRTGTPDILTIAAIRTSSNDSAAAAVFSWKEIR